MPHGQENCVDCFSAEEADGLDAPRGFEPRLTESESVVLPLDDGAPMGGREIESGLQTVNADGPFRLALALHSAIRLNAT